MASSGCIDESSRHLYQSFSPPSYHLESRSHPLCTEVSAWDFVETREFDLPSYRFEDYPSEDSQRRSGCSFAVFGLTNPSPAGSVQTDIDLTDESDSSVGADQNLFVYFDRCTRNSRNRTRRHHPRYSNQRIIYERGNQFPPFANDLFWKAFSKYKTKQNLLRLIFNVRYTSMPRILEVEEDELLKYKIVTTLEWRSITRKEEPCYSQTLAENDNGPYVSEWDVEINVPRDRHPVRKKIPGTSSIVSCSKCMGKKSIACGRCRGDGQYQCDKCHGSGHSRAIEDHRYFSPASHRYETRCRMHSVTCPVCHGGTFVRCSHCYGKGKNPCRKCDETGQLELSTEVIAQWKDQTDEFYFGNLSAFIPEKILKKSRGIRSYGNQIENGILPAINEEACLNRNLIRKSQLVIATHVDRCQGKVIRKQKHYITKIPVYLVHYRSKRSIKTVCAVGTNYKICKLDGRQSRNQA